MGLKADIQEWLLQHEFEREHTEGFVLYTKCPDVDRRIFTRLEKESSWSCSKLEYLLLEIVDTLPEDVCDPQKVVQVQPVMQAMPPEVTQLYKSQSSLKQKRSILHSKLFDFVSDDDRYAAALDIMDMTAEIEKSWAIIQEWKRTKRIPKLKRKIYKTKIEKHKRLMNLRTYVSKRNKKILNGVGDTTKLQSEVIEMKAEIQNLEKELQDV